MERLVQRLTHGPRHHFFGYYDKCPWDATGRYVPALEAGFSDRPPGHGDNAAVGMVDLAETVAWNWQQGAMLQWLPADAERLTIYNARDGDGTQICLDSAHEGKRQMYVVDVSDVVL